MFDKVENVLRRVEQYVDAETLSKLMGFGIAAVSFAQGNYGKALFEFAVALFAVWVCVAKRIAQDKAEAEAAAAKAAESEPLQPMKRTAHAKGKNRRRSHGRRGGKRRK